MWRKVWWPLIAPLVFLGIGVIAPLGLDVRDVASLPLLAAIVWIVPGVVLGPAVPLLDRPSQQTKLWSILAATLGFAVAVITVFRLHDPRYFALALLLFAVAGIFFARHDIEQYWPALALCLAIATTGLSFAVVHLTASFHQVLAQVSRINSLPPLVDEPLSLESDKMLLVLQEAPYAQRLTQARKSGTSEQLRSALNNFDAGVLGERDACVARLVAISAEKKRYLRESAGHSASDDPYYDSLDGIEGRTILDLDRIVNRESGEAEDRRDLAGNRQEATFWDHYYLGTIDTTDRISTLDFTIIETPTINAEIDREVAVRSKQEIWEKEGIAEQLEISLAGSTAFWMTVGLLAAWALRRRATTDAASCVTGESDSLHGSDVP